MSTFHYYYEEIFKNIPSKLKIARQYKSFLAFWISKFSTRLMYLDPAFSNVIVTVGQYFNCALNSPIKTPLVCVKIYECIKHTVGLLQKLTYHTEISHILYILRYFLIIELHICNKIILHNYYRF